MSGKGSLEALASGGITDPGPGTDKVTGQVPDVTDYFPPAGSSFNLPISH